MDTTELPRPQPIGHYVADRPADSKNPSQTGIDQLLRSEEGYIVGRLGNELLRLNTDTHFITSSPTGGGKGTSCIIPNLLTHPGSAFVVDIRGETLAATADARRLMGHDIVVLDPYEISGGKWGLDGYDPIASLDSASDEYEDKVANIASALMFDSEGRTSDAPIWDNSTKGALEGAIIYISTYLPKHRRTLLELNQLFLLNANGWSQFIAQLEKIVRRESNVSNSIQLLYKYLTHGADKTKITDNAIVSINTLTNWIGKNSFTRILRRTTFGFEDWQTKPMTIYLLIDEYKIKNAMPWVRILFDAALSSLKHVDKVFAPKKVGDKLVPIKSKDLSPSQRVLFLLDEFPLLGKMDNISGAMATARGRGANLWIFVQHLEQLEQYYGQHEARNMINNTAVLQAFESQEINELEYLTRVVGNGLFDVESVTINKSMTVGKNTVLTSSKSISNNHSEAKTNSLSKATTDAETVSHTVQEGTSAGNTTSNATSEGVAHSTGETLTNGSNESNNETHTKHKGKNTSKQAPHTFLDTMGIDLPWGWNNKTKNQTKGHQLSRSFVRGHSSSQSDNQSETQSTNHTDSISDFQSTNKSLNKAYTQSQTNTDTRSEAITHTEGTTTGESISEAAGKNKSDTQGLATTITPEERLIETSRSLRINISGQRQLLSVRGRHPFIASLATSFLQNPDYQVYRFPTLAYLSGEVTLLEVVNQLRCQVKTALKQARRDNKGNLARLQPFPQIILDNIEAHPYESANESSTDILEWAKKAINHGNTIRENMKTLGKEIDKAKDHILYIDSLLANLSVLTGVEPLAICNYFELDRIDSIQQVINEHSIDQPLQALHQIPEARECASFSIHAARENVVWAVRHYLRAYRHIHPQLHQLEDGFMQYYADISAADSSLENYIGKIEAQAQEKMLTMTRFSIQRRHAFSRE